VVGERSSGFGEWVDGAVAYTRRNLIGRLFTGREENAKRLIHLGSLYSTELRDDPPFGDSPPVPPDRPGDGRTEQQRVNDSATYDKIVALANFATAFGLSVDNVRAVATQAAHLAETGGHSLVATVCSKVQNSWLQHAVSAALSGRKTTVSCYRVAVAAFCAWAEEKSGGEAVVVPVSRTTVVTFLEAERVRRLLPRKRQRANKDTADDEGNSSAEDYEDEVGRGGGAGAEGGEMALMHSGGRRAGGGSLGSTEADVRPGGGGGTTTDCQAGMSAAATRSASGGGRADGLAVPNVLSTGGGLHDRAGTARPCRVVPGRQVGPQVLLNALNALAKIGNTFNLLWRDTKCP